MLPAPEGTDAQTSQSPSGPAKNKIAIHVSKEVIEKRAGRKDRMPQPQRFLEGFSNSQQCLAQQRDKVFEVKTGQLFAPAART